MIFDCIDSRTCKVPPKSSEIRLRHKSTRISSSPNSLFQKRFHQTMLHGLARWTSLGHFFQNWFPRLLNFARRNRGLIFLSWLIFEWLQELQHILVGRSPFGWMWHCIKCRPRSVRYELEKQTRKWQSTQLEPGKTCMYRRWGPFWKYSYLIIVNYIVPPVFSFVGFAEMTSLQGQLYLRVS